MNKENRVAKGWMAVVAVAVLLMAATAQAQFAGPAVGVQRSAGAVDAQLQTRAYSDVRVQPGDMLSVIVLGAPEMSSTMAQGAAGSVGVMGTQTGSGFRVDLKGNVQIPYLGKVNVAGRDPEEIAELLEQQLQKRGLLTEPEVTVSVLDSPSRMISVLGEVQKPSPVMATPTLRLMDAISYCGGFTVTASHVLSIRRNGMSEAIQVDLGTDPNAAALANIPLYPGDTILVPRVGNSYVLGEVKTPQAVPLAGNTPITVMRAVTIAGGVKYSAALSKARIIRTTADNRKIELPINLRKVMQGKEPDPVLAADDVLYIPANLFKMAVSNNGVYGVTQVVEMAVWLNQWK